MAALDNDTMSGGGGNDSAFGGQGNDIYYFSSAQAGDFVGDGFGRDYFDGGSGDKDTLYVAIGNCLKVSG